MRAGITQKGKETMNVTFTQKGENNAYVLSFTNKESFQNMMTCILGMAERVIVEEHYNDFVELTSLLQGRYQPDDTTFVYTSEASDIIKKMMILSACGNSTMDEIMEYISELNSVFVEKSFRYGNSIVLLNNLLYYCEILNISNIYLNSNQDWPIFENTTLPKLNISFVNKENINLEDRNITCFNKNHIYFQSIIKPEIRIDKLKYEIKCNLPKVKISPKDLYIHIRSGDIFKYKSNQCLNYAQPPFCFYENILNHFDFGKIFIVAQDKLNPIIDLLVRRFPDIIIVNNSLKEDISILMNAFNVVSSISSFLTMIIIFNDNLKNLWEYDIYRLPEKYLHLHRDLYNYKINYSIYKMLPSNKYKTMMLPWRNTKEQRELMIHEKCGNFQFISSK